MHAEREIVEIGLAQCCFVRESRIVSQPGIGNQLNDAPQFFCREERRHPCIDFGKGGRLLEQYMVFDQRERVPRVLIAAIPCMMKIQGRSVIDEPEPAVPDQHIDVAHRAIDVAYERIEPDNGRSQLRIWDKYQWIESD